MNNKFLYVFFSDRKKVNNLEKILQTLPQNSYFVFREYDLARDMRAILAKNLLKISRQKGIKFIIGKDFNLAKNIGADGCHYSDNMPIDHRALRQNNKKNGFILSYSCHSLKSVFFVKKIKADIVFISPIFDTTTHPDSKSLGKIGYLKAKFHFPQIMPLGGVDHKNITFFKKIGALGFGAIDYFNNL